MILVIEGPSASGKTTWVHRHAGAAAIAETVPATDAPHLESDPLGTLETWQRWNEARWAAAIALEQRTGLAVTDGDPLKLHYIWCLWQVGHASEAEWHYAASLARNAFAAGTLGIADRICVADVDETELRRRKDADPTRRRGGFELHVAVAQSLHRWYEAVASLHPGRVSWSLPDEMPATVSREPRSGQSLFDDLMRAVMERSDPRPPVDEDAWYDRVRLLLESAYLRSDDPRAQSGKSGDATTWELARRPVVAAVSRPGTYLDIGCANGLLMESIERWSREDGHPVESHGLDISQRLAGLARTRLPQWRDRTTPATR